MDKLKAFWKKHKKTNVFVLKSCLLFILFNNLYTKFSGEEFNQTIALFQSEFSWSKIHYLFIAIALTFFNWAFETLKFYLCVQRVEPISYWRAYKGILIGNALNMILPASLGELTGRPMVLKEENRINGSGVAYYVSIVQKVASPIVGLIFLWLAYHWQYLSTEQISIFKWKFSIASFLVIISILDLVFWLTMYIYPLLLVKLLAKMDSFKKIFELMGEYLNYNFKLKLKLFGIGCIRFLIFVTQYWVLMFLFFNQFPLFEFFILCGVYFLAQFVIPSLGFLDIGIRANLVIFVFSLYTQNFIQLIAVNYLIWIINLLLPSLFGFYLMRKTLNPFKLGKG